MMTPTHAAPITCVDVWDKNYVSGSYDCSVIMWNDRSAVWRFNAGDLINDVRFSSDGRFLAVAAADRYAYILDTTNGHIARRCGPHSDDVNAAAWSPDGVQLVTVTDALSTDVNIWDWKSETVTQQLQGHEHGVFAVEYSPTGDLIATSAEDRTARIWTRYGSALVVLQHPGDPETLTWLNDNEVLTGCDDGIVRVWDVRCGELVRAKVVSAAAVRLVRRSTDGASVAIGSYDGAIQIVRADTLEGTIVCRHSKQWERTGAIRADGTLVAGSFGDQPVLHFDGNTSEPGSTFGINRIVQGQDMVIAGLDSGHVVDIRSKRVITRHSSIVNALGVTRQDGRSGDEEGIVVFSGDYHGSVKRCVGGKVIGGQSVWINEDSRHFGGGPINAIAATDHSVVMGNYAGELIVTSHWLDIQLRIKAHSGPIKDLACNNDIVYTAGADDTLRAYTLGGSEVFVARAPHVTLINSLALARSAGWIVTGSREGRVALWSLADGRLLETLPDYHEKSVKSVAASDDGEVIVSSSYDAQAMVWRKSRLGWEPLPLRWHRKPGVPTCVLNKEGVILAGWDGFVSEWSLNGFLKRLLDVRSLLREDTME